jgi:hypothetical protein
MPLNLATIQQRADIVEIRPLVKRSGKTGLNVNLLVILVASTPLKITNPLTHVFVASVSMTTMGNMRHTRKVYVAKLTKTDRILKLLEEYSNTLNLQWDNIVTLQNATNEMEDRMAEINNHYDMMYDNILEILEEK